MPQFDRLFASMAQRNVSRAILSSNQPMQLTVGDQTIAGAPLTGTALLGMLAEVVPANQQPALNQDGQFDVFYQTPQGNMRINIARQGEALRAVIDKMPDAYAQAPSPQTAFDPLNPASPFNTAPSSAPATPYPTQQTPTPPAPYGGSPYPTAPGYGEPNSSGGGAMALVPPEIQGKWNWGAFFGSWIWGIAHSTWIGLLCFVPCVGLFMPFVLGAKGNEWGWRNKRFNSVEEFKKTQTTWAIVGLVIRGVLFLPGLLIFMAIVAPVFGRARVNAQRASSQSNMKRVGLAVIQFSQANNDKFPVGRTASSWQIATAPYVSSPDIFIRPITKEPYNLNPSLSGVDFAAVTDMAGTPMFYEAKEDDLGGHNVLFTDGHVKWIRRDNWQPYRTYLDSAGGE